MTNPQLKNAPTLRFKEFTSDWQLCKLGKFFSFKNGINADKTQYGIGYKFINVLDIISNKPMAANNLIGRVSVSEQEFSKNEVVHGDIMFQRSSETRKDVGQSNIYLDKSQSATFGGFVIRGRPIKNISSLYFNSLLKTQKIRNEITSRSGGSTRYNVGQKALSEVVINISTNLKEQNLIASFLSSVDIKIDQLNKKKDLLEKYKKGMMQKLFSQEIRFKADDGSDFLDWEEKRLGDITDITTGRLDANAMVENGRYRFYTCAKDYFQIDEYAFDTDALLVSGNGANVGYVHHYHGKFNAYQRTYVLDKLTENIFFVKFHLDYFLKRRIAKEKKDGNTPYIVMGTLYEMKVQIPQVNEQQKIAYFLYTIETKINQTNTQIEQANTFKKGLLQQMFV